MTGRRRPSSPRPFKAAVLATATTAVGAALLSLCGAIPGIPDRSKAPVTVMTWAPEGTGATNMPGMPAMAKAYARWVNEQGGLNGHELKVLTCNDHNNTVGAGRCARRALSRDVVAVVGSYSQYGHSYMPQLEAEGIPYIGGYGVTDEEFTSPLSYPVNGGQASLLAGNGRQLARSCTEVSLVRPDTIAGDQMPSFLNSGLAQGRRGTADDIRAPEDATDYSRQARRAMGGADSCVTAALGDRTDTFFDSFRRLQPDGLRVRLASVLGSVQQSLVTRTGSKLDGASVTGWYPVASDRRWDPMRRVIRDHAFGDNRIDAADPGVQTTWIAYTVLREAVKSLGDDGEVTAHSVRRALDGPLGDGGVDTGGLTPELSWRYEDMLAVKGFPRITNAMVTYQRVRDGRLVAERDGFVDVSGTLEHRREEG
ncbi:ABC transporter substrate-binding protein [Streptomyces sp. bgisy100]|uniref:ABC transporter substrate-binding protein n=1 Tax=Streptomyces sp. bgisy100 TaxID=3413783 RepID=UPI003D740F83